MITISRDDKKLKVTISPNMSNANVMSLYWDCGGEWYAELLSEKINRELRDLLERIRKAEYQSGWKDAKSKKVKKREWFRSSFYDGAP